MHKKIMIKTIKSPVIITVMLISIIAIIFCATDIVIKNKTLSSYPVKAVAQFRSTSTQFGEDTIDIFNNVHSNIKYSFTYEYTYNGKNYEITFPELNSSNENFGYKTVVFINPANPEQAIFARKYTYLGDVLLIIGAVLFILLTCSYYYIRNRNIFLDEQSAKSLNLIYGKDLLNALEIDNNEKYFEENPTNRELLSALINCQQLLEESAACKKSTKNILQPILSNRQCHCAKSALQLIMQNNFTYAFHELKCCIDDYGNGQNRLVSMNEYVLYNCIISCFTIKLNTGDSNHYEHGCQSI